MAPELDFVASQPHYERHLLPLVKDLAIRGVTIYPADPAGGFLRDASILVASFRDAYNAHQLGYRKIALLEHGIGQSYSNDHPAYPGGASREIVSLFLEPNETAAARDRARYPDARVEVVGDPHLASLPARVSDGKTTVCFSFHWSSPGSPELRSALDHYWQAMAKLRTQLPDLTFIGHSHPRHDLSDFYEWLGWEYVRDFDDVCRRADLYVCDNSSTIYEFASTGRPVVVLNVPWFQSGVEHGLRFWEASYVGLHVDDSWGLVDALTTALGQGPIPLSWTAEREAALAIVYQQKADPVDVILDWLGAAVPA